MTETPLQRGGEAEEHPAGLRVKGLGRNAAWVYLNAGGSSVGGLFVLAYAFRRIGASNYGSFALVASIFGVLTTLDFGLRFLVMRSTARDSDGFSEASRQQARIDIQGAHTTYAVWGATVLVATVAATAVVAATASPIEARRDLPVVIFLVGLSLSLNLATQAYVAIPAGRRCYHVPSIAGLLGTAVEIGAVVTTINRLDLVSLGLAYLANTVVSQGYCALWVTRHEQWMRHRPRWLGWTGMRRVVSFAAPLFLLAVAGQVISATDLVVVGLVATSAAVGVYRAGSTVPSQSMTLLFTGYDTIYPVLAGTGDSRGQEAATRFLTRVASFIGGAVFAVALVLRVDVVSVVIGHPSVLAESVLVVFCFVWLANVPAHAISILLIARGRQRSLVWLVGGETALNLCLTVMFTVELGPVGAAYATLVAIVLSNLIALPILVRHQIVSVEPWRLVMEGIGSGLTGGAVAAAAAGVAFEVVGVWPRLFVGVSLAGLVSIVVGLLLLGRGGRALLASMLRMPRGEGVETA